MDGNSYGGTGSVSGQFVSVVPQLHANLFIWTLLVFSIAFLVYAAGCVVFVTVWLISYPFRKWWRGDDIKVKDSHQLPGGW